MNPLTERERSILIKLPDDGTYVRPMDIGGTDASTHSATLRSLCRKGIVERQRRNSLMNMLGSSRGSYLYRRVPIEWKPGDEATTFHDGEHVRLLSRIKRATDDGFNWIVRLANPRPNTSDEVEFPVYEGNLLPVRK